MANQYNKKDKTKSVIWTHRPSTAMKQGVEMYIQESGGSTRAEALEELIQLGLTVWIQRLYKGEQ